MDEPLLPQYHVTERSKDPLGINSAKIKLMIGALVAIALVSVCIFFIVYFTRSPALPDSDRITESETLPMEDDVAAPPTPAPIPDPNPIPTPEPEPIHRPAVSHKGKLKIESGSHVLAATATTQAGAYLSLQKSGPTPLQEFTLDGETGELTVMVQNQQYFFDVTSGSNSTGIVLVTQNPSTSWEYRESTGLLVPTLYPDKAITVEDHQASVTGATVYLWDIIPNDSQKWSWIE